MSWNSCNRTAWLGGCLGALFMCGVIMAANRAGADEAAASIVVGTPERIEVYPTQVKLDAAHRTMHMIVSGFYADRSVQDLTSVAELKTKDDKVVRADGGVIQPVGNGHTEVTVSVGGRELLVPVDVSKQELPDRVSFNYGTLAVLSKQGCNSGACHGSPSGKGGFRLSLCAYDPALDIETLVARGLQSAHKLVRARKQLDTPQTVDGSRAWRRAPAEKE